MVLWRPFHYFICMMGGYRNFKVKIIWKLTSFCFLCPRLLATGALSLTPVRTSVRPKIFAKDFFTCVCWIDFIFGLKHYQS